MKKIIIGVMGPGTASEIALAIKADKNVILLTNDEEAKTFFKNWCFHWIYGYCF